MHSYDETNQIIPNRNDDNMQPKQTNFSNTMYRNSGGELESEKFKTYSDSATSNSELFHEFIFEKEEKPFHIAAFSIDQIPTQAKKISSSHDFITDFKFYIHCNMCLTIIAGESN